MLKLNVKLRCTKILKMKKRDRFVTGNYLKLQKEIHVSNVLQTLRVLKKYVKL